jgi:glutamate synthase (NADPH/NADH) large chain/glutamate synthase (ferredoxin)
MQPLVEPGEMEELRHMIEQHVQYTGSKNGKRLLDNWKIYSAKFVRVIPKAYLKINERISKLQESGMAKSDAEMAAFEESKMATGKA